MRLTWKEHPGIWFVIYVIDATFFLLWAFTILPIHETLNRIIWATWNALTLWGIVHYHVRWIESHF